MNNAQKVQCPECISRYSEKSLKPHLVKRHGYQYADDGVRLVKPTDTQWEDELRDTSFRWLKTVQGFTPEATLLSLQELLSTQREQAQQEERETARSGLLGRLYVAGLISPASLVVAYRTLLSKDLKPVEAKTIERLQTELTAPKEENKNE